jgi:LexA-binding, inner membrane-associated putative hydrolase
MPSPVGHAIAGMAAGWLVAGASRVSQKVWEREAMLFGALGVLPDIDLLFGAHSGPTHSLGAAVIVGITAFVMASGLTAVSVHDSLPDTTAPTARCAVRPGRLALACAAAYASHVLLDWLGRDSSPPIGIMALWPLSRDYFESALHVFMPISRRFDQGWTLVSQNAWAVCLEMIILVPILLLVMFFRPHRVRWENA